ncbi:MAG: hypothetical protein IKC45_07695 [Clostridia bacterium]|nr:hypothetical protein [Clostridia bacterium]
MSNRRANAVLFGFDFQVNAAIVLMLENIKELDSLRLEGNHEDIELKLTDETYILAQAKAVEDSSSDFRNVRSNMKKALTSLSEGAEKVNVKKLIFITNSPNPFNDDESRSIFWGPAQRDYSTLPPSAKKIVDDYLENIDNPLDPNEFMIQVLPFETDNDVERYKAVMLAIDNFIGSLNINIPGLGNKLLEIWHRDIFTNGTKKDAEIKLNKKNIIWPILVITTDIHQSDEEFLEQFDPSVYDEIVNRYSETINTCCERIEFFTKVLYDYNLFKGKQPPSKRGLEFVDACWQNYSHEFSVNGIDNETLEGLTKIIVYNIIRRRLSIDKIKRGVAL